MARIFDGLVNDGIYESIGTAMMVTPSSGMTVNVGIGRAWFNHTWTFNDSILPIELDASSSVYSRIDAIVLKIDTRKVVRENSIVVIKGPEAVNPVKPSIATGDEEVFQYPLAYVKVKKNAVEITYAEIENRVGMSETPFVTGIVQVMSIDAMIAQWNSEWQQWLASKPAEFQAYIDSETSQIAAEHRALTAFIADEESEISSEHDAYTAYIANFESGMDTWKDAQESDFLAWTTNRKSAFDAWFANVQYVLDGDAAGHLQNEIDDINNNWDELSAQLTNEVETEITRLTTEVEAEIAASEEQLFNYYYELDSKTTTIINGVITEVSSKATAVTTFTDVAGGKDIVTTITPDDDDYEYIKTTQIREANGTKTITESFTKQLKEA